MTRLLQDYPDLRLDAERLAAELLATVDPEVIAADLGLSLELLHVKDVYQRPRPWRGNGCLEPSEAACGLLEAEVEPFLDDVRRRAGQGLLESRAALAGRVSGRVAQSALDEEQELVRRLAGRGCPSCSSSCSSNRWIRCR